jgi:hypothetical protein
MSVLNDATENTTHFNAGFALHEDDKALVKKLQEGDRTTMTPYDRQRAMYCQGLRAKATIDVLALGTSASQSMTAHNVKNSMNNNDRTTKECHTACYQSDHSALTVEITLNESNLIRRSGTTGSICSVIGNPNNYRVALLTHLQTDARGTRREHFHNWAQNTNRNYNGRRWRRTIHRLIKQCVQANMMRMMMGLPGNLTTRNAEQCHPERLQLKMIPKHRRERIIEMAGVGEIWSKQDQTHCNKQIHEYSIQHRLYTHAHNIRKRMHNCKHFKNVPFTRKRNAIGIFQETEMKLALENCIRRLTVWMEGHQRDNRQRSLITLWRTNSGGKSGTNSDETARTQYTSSTPDVFDCWELSILEKVAIRVSIKTCQLAAMKSANYRLSWNSIPMATTHWLKNGPVALMWSVRMTLLEPKHLAKIGKQHPKTLRNKEIALIKEKLNTVRKCSTISIPVTQRHDLPSKQKTYEQRTKLCMEAYKQRKHLKDLCNAVNNDEEQPDIPHYIADNSEKRNAIGQINNIQIAEIQGKHDSMVEIHPSWTYKEIGPGTAGQADDEDQLYKIPASICNIQQSRKLMEHAEKGTLKPELYARCRTAHDGITYLSGTTTYGTKQHYCKNMLFDTGCDFNITSAWYLRDMLGKEWKEMVKPIPGRTITTKMATGHASQAIGTITMEVTFAVTTLDGNDELDGPGPQPLVEVNQLVEGKEHQDEIGWTTTTKAIEYLVFEGIDLPVINGAPFLSHVVSDISCHDQAPTHARIHETPYVHGKKRKPPEQCVMMRRRRVAPLTQILVCCAQEDTWVSTLQPQLIAVAIPGCTKVAKVGVYKDGKIIDEEPNLDTNLGRVPLHYLMDTLQQ